MFKVHTENNNSWTANTIKVVTETQFSFIYIVPSSGLKVLYIVR